MTCTPCQASHEAPMHRYHCLGCIYCGARSIQRIQRFQLTQAQIVARCRDALAAWVAHGHAENEIRRLAKSAELVCAPKSGEGNK